MEKMKYICEVYTDFIFVNRFGESQHQGTVNRAIYRIIRDCNDAQFVVSENVLPTMKSVKD